MAKKDSSQTPLMQQYYAMKAKYPDALMLYRMGDFYETFGSDAIIASKILGITLTKRSHGAAGDVELAGFPHHAIDSYLPKLVRAGQRVAICEQLEDPKLAKTIVKRGIIELVTPGVSYSECGQDNRSNQFVAAVYFDNKGAGVSLLDMFTGEFLTTEGTMSSVEKILNGFQPKEVVYQKSKKNEFTDAFGSKFYTYPIEDWFFDEESCSEKLKKHFGVSSLKGFGVDRMSWGISSAGAILNYLELTKHDMLSHITSLSRIDESHNVLLDKFTIRNLELVQPVYEGGKSLIDILDYTSSPMGSRLLKRWLTMPLKSVSEINDRLEVVACFVKQQEIHELVKNILSEIGDIERLASKVGVGRVNPREMNQLAVSLDAIPSLRECCEKCDCDALKHIVENLDPCRELYENITKTLKPTAPQLLSKGDVIADGVNSELDELRNLSKHGKEMLLAMQQREIEKTGINNLKIGFNNVFGYYIEVSKGQKDKAPDSWIRKQTLVNGERYITPELKEYEDKILGAEDRISVIESEIYNNLVSSSVAYIHTLQLDARHIAALDALSSFAEASRINEYNKPIVSESDEIIIKGGRHPVIEKQLPEGEPYISNDVTLNKTDQQIMIITGPNMAGKSALLRQTALIVIMAQSGCFVPADSAEIGYVDKIFTRVGASDNISQGESTFMVEMNEAASILNNISDRSLVLFDELGRGTSTYDGISIAWSIVEFLHENPKHRAMTLFATHYHELNEMEHSFPKIKNYNVSVKEVDNKVIFLRKLVRGGSNHSFGIQVGKMAGLPKSVTKRATDILQQMEEKHGSNKAVVEKNIDEIINNRSGMQLSFFQLDDPVLSQIRDELKGLDLNNVTPLDALNKLSEIKKITGL